MLSVALILVLQAGDCRTERQWKEAGLESSCTLLHEVPSAQRVEVLSTRWSLTKEQAECALEAVNASPVYDRDIGEHFPDPGPWNRCVSRWPNVKALWVGLFAARGDGEDFAPQLSEELADDLYRLSFANHAPLALRLFKARPERLQEFLRGSEGWHVARTIWAEHPSGVRAEDWEPLARKFLEIALFSGELILAADFWKELPEPTRKALGESPLLHDQQDLRADLALALVLAGDKEAAKLIPLEGDPLLADVVRWNLTGRRTISAWEAAIESQMINHRVWFRANDVPAALYPFIAPHFALSDARDVVNDGFDSHVTGNSALSRRLRSARARAFLLLKAAVEKKPDVVGPRSTERVQEVFTAYFAERGCLAAARAAWEEVRVKPREGYPQSWTLTSPSPGICERPNAWGLRSPRTITLNGDDHAYIEFYLGSARADRDSSGKLQVKILKFAIP